MHVVPLVLAVPLTGAALLVAISRAGGERLCNTIAVATAVATTAFCAYVVNFVLSHGTIVYWMGGWSPQHHVGIGIDFAVDGAGASAALLASFVTTLVIVYSMEYFKDSGPLFNVLLLVFLGAACACFYTGDLFDLFVFFELSNIATFSLCAYRVRDETALDGAFVFVITNSVAAFAILFGLALLEGYTDQLNLATIGQFLAVHPAQALAVGAFGLAATGFLLRGALVPFHFWLPDAQSSAPAPVGALFSAITVEIGLYAFARVYWVTFSSAFHDVGLLRTALVAFGSASALFGAVMAFGAHHLKRLISYVTIANAGVVLTAIGLLSSLGIAAAMLYAGAFSLAAAALLLCAGMVAHRFNSLDELDLWGRGREIPVVGVIFFIAALCAAGLPCFGTFAGRALLFAAAKPYGFGWSVALVLFTATLTGAALLKAVGSIWLGLGDPDPELTRANKKNKDGGSGDESDQPESKKLGWHLFVPSLLMCAAAFVAPLLPQLWNGVQIAAVPFVDRAHYYALTVYGHASSPPGFVPQTLDFGASLWCGFAALLGACILAAAALYEKRLRVLHGVAEVLAKGMEFLEHFHDGKIGDYVTWFVLGGAIFGGMLFVAYK